MQINQSTICVQTVFIIGKRGTYSRQRKGLGSRYIKIPELRSLKIIRGMRYDTKRGLYKKSGQGFEQAYEQALKELK